MPAEFPQLKSGAVAQYPSERERIRRTRVLRFVDGSEQRFPESGASQRRWVIRLTQLDEGELAQLGEFFEQQQGRAGRFPFTDPWDGTAYPDCSFEQDTLDVEFEGVGRGSAQVVIKENR